MWINFENGHAINLAQAVSVFIDNDTLFYITAAFPDGNTEILKAFDNENDAKKFIAKVVDALNKNEPLSYAFTWLAKSAENKPVETKTTGYEEVIHKPCDDSDEKHKNEILQDGQWY